MALPVQRIADVFYGSVAQTALQPLVTAPLLWALTKSPASLRERLLRILEGLPAGGLRTGAVVKALKWLVALGVVIRINRGLNAAALNHWRWTTEKRKWSNWPGEIAVVTGGSGGIAEHIVKGLVAQGVRVAVLDMRPLPATMSGYAHIRHFECDIASSKAVAETATQIRETFGAPTILVNNAATGAQSLILDTTEESLHRIINVNALSHYSTVKAFLPDMIKNNKGHIVTVSSTAAYITTPSIVDYCMSKAAVTTFHEGLSLELKHSYKAPSVLTTIVHPNWVRTPLIGEWATRFEAKGVAMLEAKDVGDAIVKQILSARGGQLLLPEKLHNLPAIRGWPNWLQELVRDDVAKLDT